MEISKLLDNITKGFSESYKVSIPTNDEIDRQAENNKKYLHKYRSHIAEAAMHDQKAKAEFSNAMIEIEKTMAEYHMKRADYYLQKTFS